MVEIVPPSVETALHRDKSDPDDNKKSHGSQGALSIQEFMDEIKEGWQADRNVCTAGPGHEIIAAWSDAVGSRYAGVEKKYIEATRST